MTSSFGWPFLSGHLDFLEGSLKSEISLGRGGGGGFQFNCDPQVYLDLSSKGCWICIPRLLDLYSKGCWICIPKGCSQRLLGSVFQRLLATKGCLDLYSKVATGCLPLGCLDLYSKKLLQVACHGRLLGSVFQLLQVACHGSGICIPVATGCLPQLRICIPNKLLQGACHWICIPKLSTTGCLDRAVLDREGVKVLGSP